LHTEKWNEPKPVTVPGVIKIFLDSKTKTKILVQIVHEF